MLTSVRLTIKRGASGSLSRPTPAKVAKTGVRKLKADKQTVNKVTRKQFEPLAHHPDHQTSRCDNRSEARAEKRGNALVAEFYGNGVQPPDQT